MSMGLISSGPIRNAFPYDREEHVARLKALIDAGPEVYWIGMGSKDFLYNSVIDLLALYDEAGLKYIYL